MKPISISEACRGTVRVRATVDQRIRGNGPAPIGAEGTIYNIGAMSGLARVQWNADPKSFYSVRWEEIEVIGPGPSESMTNETFARKHADQTVETIDRYGFIPAGTRGPVVGYLDLAVVIDVAQDPELGRVFVGWLWGREPQGKAVTTRVTAETRCVMIPYQNLRPLGSLKVPAPRDPFPHRCGRCASKAFQLATSTECTNASCPCPWHVPGARGAA